MTESPLRNIFEMNRSLFTGAAFLAPFPVFGTSLQISLTFSRTMLQWRSNALTRPRSFRLFLQLIKTCEFVLTLCVKTDNGPVWNSCSSDWSAYWGEGGVEGGKRKVRRSRENQKHIQFAKRLFAK